MTQLRLPDASLHVVLQDKVPFLKRLLDTHGSTKQMQDLVQGMHASEIAYLIQYLERPYRDAFLLWLKPHFDPEIFVFLAPHVREESIALLSPKEIVSILSVLESDDALAILSSLEDETRQEVLVLMPTLLRHDFLRRLNYPPQSAGRLMQQEVLIFPKDWTIKEGLEYVAHSADAPEQCYDAFVVDQAQRPVGILPLSFLIKKPKNLYLYEVMDTDLRIIPAYWTQEEVAFTFRLYDLMSAPVVDHRGIIVGLITADDVIDVVERKATEDLMHMGRVHGSDFYESVVHTSISRLHWLVVTVLNSLLTSLVINEFQETLKAKVSLAILMPIAAAMGGNTGIQTTTIVIRALATKELGTMNMMRALGKEVRVALLNGLIFGFTLGGVTFFWFSDLNFGLTLGAAILFNMVWAGAAGTLLPVMISRMGFDPALSAGPLLTTTTDVIGYAIFLGLARLVMF